MAFDPCYHQACDTIRNVSRQALNELGDAAAHSVVRFAQRFDAVSLAPARAAAARNRGLDSFLYRGGHLQK